MYSKRLAIIAGPIAVLLISLFFFQSSFSERRLRIQKEKALTESLAKLNESEAQITELKRQREELEATFKEKISGLETSVKSLEDRNASLEAALKEQETSVRTLTDKTSELEKQKQALMEDNLDKSQNVTDLEKKITDLESGREELLAKIKELEGKKAAAPPKAAKSVNQELRYEPPAALNPSKVGKILIQKSTGRSAQIQHVNEVYDFIVINAGAKDGLKNGSVINVIREDRIIAKAVVEKLKPDLSAALLVPESKLEAVQVGDFVTQF